jgi:hypothetical protein
MGGAPRFGRGRTSLEPRDGAGIDIDSGCIGTGSGTSGKYEERRSLVELNDYRMPAAESRGAE